MIEKQFPKSVDLIKHFGHKRPPVIPYALLIITEHIVDRLSCNILNSCPSSIMCLFKHSKFALKNQPEMLQSFLDMALNLKVYKNKKMRRAIRYKACGKYSNEIVFGSFLEFCNRCHGGMRITLTYPVDCWIVIGPDICGTHGTIEAKFLKEVNSFLGEYCLINPILKDFFCLTLQILSNIMWVSRVRSKPGTYSHKIVQYFLARKFGPSMIEVKCKYCNKIINKLRHKPCIECCEIIRRCGFSLPISTMSNLLQYTTVPFWENTMRNPRPNGKIYRNEELNKKGAFMQYAFLSSSDCFFIPQKKSDFNLPNYSSVISTSEAFIKINSVLKREVNEPNYNENTNPKIQNTPTKRDLTKNLSKITAVSNDNKLLKKVDIGKKEVTNIKFPSRTMSEIRSTATEESLFDTLEGKLERQVDKKQLENQPSISDNQKLTETKSKNTDEFPIDIQKSKLWSHTDSKVQINESLDIPNHKMNETLSKSPGDISVYTDDSKKLRNKDFDVSKVTNNKNYPSSVINFENTFLYSISGEDRLRRSMKLIENKIKNSNQKKSEQRQRVNHALQKSVVNNEKTMEETEKVNINTAERK